jgi:hypothetical protein
MTMQAFLEGKELASVSSCFFEMSILFYLSTFYDEVIPYHKDMSWESAPLKLKLEFFWAPVINASMHKVRGEFKLEYFTPFLIF